MADEIEQLRAELVAANNDLKIVLDTLRDRNVLLTESEDELARLREELHAAVDVLRDGIGQLGECGCRRCTGLSNRMEAIVAAYDAKKENA